MNKTPTFFLAAGALAAAVLAGCAGYSPAGVTPGQSADQVVAKMGSPTGRYTLPAGGSRLEFARGPFGKHTYMVDLNAGGQVTGWRQVLTENEFNAVVPGIRADELLLRLGHPSNRRGGGWQGGEVWSYRYDAIFCQWWQASVKDGVVTSVAYAPDPLCEVNDRELLSMPRMR